MHLRRSLKRFYPLLREYYTREFSRNSPSDISKQQLHNVLSKYEDETIFVHVGLSDLNTALSGNPYEILTSVLFEEFETILTPGFTPSFRASGIYDKQSSRPEVGMFPLLFMNDAEYRTNDAIHSILISGEYRLNDCNHQRSFGEDGCWAQLDQDNILIANIGTNRLVSTQYHYISLQADVPYHTEETHSGTIVFEDGSRKAVEQVNDTFRGRYNWNRWKMEHYLNQQGVLERADMNGLKISLFHAQDMRLALESQLAKDPYYMVC